MNNLLALALLFPLAAAAQTYPAKPIRMVIPFGPGGAIDGGGGGRDPDRLT